MKHLNKTKNNGKDCWCVRLPKLDGTSKRKFFKTKFEAITFLNNSKAFSKSDVSELMELTTEQIADIKLALSKLPKGVSLSACVDLMLLRQIVSKDFFEAIEDFLKIKENKKLSKIHNSSLKTRLGALKNFSSWASCTPTSLFKYLDDKKLSPKTKSHYLGVWREFFEWAKTRRYVQLSPFDDIHRADLPKVEASKNGFLSIEKMQEFFELCEKAFPEYVSYFALVAFAGIRRSEAFQLKKENFDFENKTILIKSEISKTGRNWLQANLPSNVWAWLEAYPLKPITERKSVRVFTKLNEDLKMPHNSLRHSFATYHLSLKRNAPATSLLMRHRSPNQLWQTYLGDLVSVKEAEKYFNILP